MPIAALALLALQSAAPPPAEPSWAMGVDGVTCLLSRDGEIGGKPSLLQIRLDVGSPAIEIEVMAAAKAVPSLGRSDPAISVSLGGALVTGKGFSRPASGGRSLMTIRIPVDTIDRMPAGANDLTVTNRDRSITIPAPRLAAALAHLRSCHNGQLRRVGIDPIMWATGRLPMVDEGGRLVGHLYEEVGAMPRRVGDTTVLLKVDAKGDIRSCDIIATVDPKRGVLTCEIARNSMRAKPAVDAAGNPIAGTTLLTVNWTR